MTDFLKNFSPFVLHQYYLTWAALEKEGITIDQVKEYIVSHDIRLEPDSGAQFKFEKPEEVKKLRKSGKRIQFGKPIGDPKPFSTKRIGCGKCREKEARRA